MGTIQHDGYYEVLLVRECTLCRFAEAWSGEQSTEAQRIRLYGAAPLAF